MWKEVQPTDEYRVQLNGMLHSSDRSILQSLYQPLVGASSISLYSQLWEEVDRNALESSTSTHATLLSMLSVNIDDIFEARIHLEGMGLLKTFLKGGDVKEFLYQLQPPLTAKDFFEDPMLSIFLYRQVGNSQFQRLKKQYIVPYQELTSYREVTRSFQDVYSSEALIKKTSDSSQPLQENEMLSFRAENKGVETDFVSFDFHLLVAGLTEVMVPRKALTYPVKNMIGKLATLYGLSEMDMKSVVMTAVNEENEIIQLETERFYDEKNLKKWIGNCSNYKKINNVKVPTVIKATWRLKQDDHNYAIFNLKEIEHDIPNKYWYYTATNSISVISGLIPTLPGNPNHPRPLFTCKY